MQARWTKVTYYGTKVRFLPGICSATTKSSSCSLLALLQQARSGGMAAEGQVRAGRREKEFTLAHSRHHPCHFFPTPSFLLPCVPFPNHHTALLLLPTCVFRYSRRRVSPHPPSVLLTPRFQRRHRMYGKSGLTTPKTLVTCHQRGIHTPVNKGSKGRRTTSASSQPCLALRHRGMQLSSQRLTPSSPLAILFQPIPTPGENPPQLPPMPCLSFLPHFCLISL